MTVIRSNVIFFIVVFLSNSFEYPVIEKPCPIRAGLFISSFVREDLFVFRLTCTLQEL